MHMKTAGGRVLPAWAHTAPCATGCLPAIRIIVDYNLNNTHAK